MNVRDALLYLSTLSVNVNEPAKRMKLHELEYQLALARRAGAEDNATVTLRLNTTALVSGEELSESGGIEVDLLHKRLTGETRVDVEVEETASKCRLELNGRQEIVLS